ncbi:hypothetical protein, partial [Streptomyces sp. NPDC051016]|uniref:hypothetical protein n=1 Tax=Streptomyces sp. NPDC051016 TaxID=3365638 RepID=UPI0037AFF5C8
MTSRQSCEGEVAAGEGLAAGVCVLPVAVAVGVAAGSDCVAVVPESDAVATDCGAAEDVAVGRAEATVARRGVGVAWGTPAVCSCGAFAVVARADG